MWGHVTQWEETKEKQRKITNCFARAGIWEEKKHVIINRGKNVISTNSDVTVITWNAYLKTSMFCRWNHNLI